MAIRVEFSFYGTRLNGLILFYILATNTFHVFYILANGLSILCSTVYASNEEMMRIDLWNYIVEQLKSFNLRWIVVGDFNSILLTYDRINNGIYNSIGDQHFMDCISSSNLTESDLLVIFSHGEEV